MAKLRRRTGVNVLHLNLALDQRHQIPMTGQHPGLNQLLEKIQRKKRERWRCSLKTFFWH
jgi:hypothetical protein